MKDLINFLKENSIMYLATLGLDGKAKVRPIEFMKEISGKLYFCTNNKKLVYKELEKSPDLELTTATPQYVWVRITGKANFTNDLKIKQVVLDSSEFVKRKFETPNHPNFAVFSIEGKAVLAGLGGSFRKKYNI
ncbi:MAG: pyridoxamine 5'-phosphate oxidase family protein [Methanobacteriaceae archaeon]|jgi:uncharacterized pyridoxamine 5'-phosphate oxidase family protein|nr:pyridoxamine 5'-phosphate oxidase family protein [Candidatus Methanorudis spinitermitis]